MELPAAAPGAKIASQAVPGAPDLTADSTVFAAIDASNPVPLNLPVDATGGLPEPPMPKMRKLSRGKDKFLRKVRKSRAVCLRTPVVSIIIGRQLSGPVTTSLKAISKGEIPDVAAIVGAVAPVPVPSITVPVPA